MKYVDKMFNYLENVKLSKIKSYLLVVVSALIAWLIQSLLSLQLGTNSRLLLFTIPVLLSSLYGGFFLGIYATLLGLLLSSFYIDNNYRPLLQEHHDLITYSIFLIEGILISLLGESRKRSENNRHTLLSLEKQARKNAEQQTRIREHFIAVAAHELKSPLTSQKAYLQILQKAKRNIQCECEKYLPKIESQLDRIKVFLDDLMDVTKMQSRNLHYKFEFIDIDKSTDEAVEQIQNLLTTHKIIKKGRIHKKIYADKERIRQVITNLLSNAIKYSPDANKIVITLNQQKNFLTISIKDFGVGIEKEYQDKIFNRFFRVTGNDESVFKGLGLGLYICSEIIKKHKGKLWVESAIGEGSTFYFSIPIKPQSIKSR